MDVRVVDDFEAYLLREMWFFDHVCLCSYESVRSLTLDSS